MKITGFKCGYEREPLLAPFGFKGGYLSELWQSAVSLEGADGQRGLGLGTQSVLWSDAQVFTSYPETVGNAMMFQASFRAAELAVGIEWDTPPDLLDMILPRIYADACEITRNPRLRLTFALNALVPVDNAAWMLYARTYGMTGFDAMVPPGLRAALASHHDRLACIPLITYKVPVEEVVRAVEEGCCLLKIKIGADPGGDGDQEKMLAWDCARLEEIHAAVKDRHSLFTACGHVLYYLDANGRYDSRDRLLRLLDHIARIGALDRIILLEEPFPEGSEVDVAGIPVRLVADESAHSAKDAVELMQRGYTAMALKPIAKTLSMSLRIAALARERGVPCFCADLTVNPVLVDWNKNVAARLPALPGMTIGVVESNGHQNYRNWEVMKTYHPAPGASWIQMNDGVFSLGEDFYERSGGILEASRHYEDVAVTET